jgi:hypothetical protein
MRLLLMILCVFMGKHIVVTPGIGEVRQLYERSVTDETSCQKLVFLLEPFNEMNHPLYAGYKAAATMIRAKHAINPLSKYSYFKKGRALLEKAIAKSIADTELRFLRFTIQTNLPGFLDYNNNISADKAFIIKTFPKLVDLELKQKILDFVKTSGYITIAEKKLMLAYATK